MPDFQFDSASDFFAMGGDAFFVWTSYLLFAAFVLWCVYLPMLQRKRVVKLIHARGQREAGMQARQGNASQANASSGTVSSGTMSSGTIKREVN